MIEIWKDIKGYEKLYQVSNFGRIKSMERILTDNRLLKEKILTPCNNGNGYLYINLYKGHKISKRLAIHRLVAEAFVKRTNEEYNVVNHIDNNTKNNKADNLEWCNQEYNIKYQYKINKNRPTNTKALYQLKDNKIINTYKSGVEASKKTKIARSSIWACLIGKKDNAGGYQWRYVDEKH